MTTPIKYVGGKTRMSNNIISFIPDHVNYLELFFGGGSIFFKKKPAKLETINDINSDITTFFRVLQSKKKFKEFYKLINLTPYSRELFYLLRDSQPKNDIRKAYRFFILSRQSFAGNLKGAKGKIMISGYNSDLYNTKLKNWIKKEFQARCTIDMKSEKKERIEVIWMNYKYELQPELF